MIPPEQRPRVVVQTICTFVIAFGVFILLGGMATPQSDSFHWIGLLVGALIAVFGVWAYRQAGK